MGDIRPDSNYDVNAIYVGGVYDYNLEGHGQLHVQADQVFLYQRVAREWNF